MLHPADLDQLPALLAQSSHVLVTCQRGQRAMVARASWVMALEGGLPRVSLVLPKSSRVRAVIESTGEFALNLPAPSQQALLRTLERCQGQELANLDAAGLPCTPGTKVLAPLLDGCQAWMECVLFPDPQIEERYDLFIAEVINAWVPATDSVMPSVLPDDDAAQAQMQMV